jgi:hypothetical protein
MPYSFTIGREREMPRAAGYVCPRRTRKAARRCGRVRIDKGRRNAKMARGTRPETDHGPLKLFSPPGLDD